MAFPYTETLLLIGILFVFGSALYASVRAAPWVPVRRPDLVRIIELMQEASPSLMYDLGSGDGRILLALAQNSQARVIGYEVSFLVYLVSHVRVLFSGLRRRIEVHYGDFFSKNFSSADWVFCFLTPSAMKKLAPKFRAELTPGAWIVSYAFSIPGWVPERVDKPTQDSLPIFVYRITE